jgi:2-polyprenyl-3-methyl-5-hydroxy-6-metoxy-1,4-benzoquinol methylase
MEYSVKLIIGPSSSGKSTWLQQSNVKNPVFAFQFTGDEMPCASSVLHYNSLFLGPSRKKAGKSLVMWDPLEHDLLRQCFQGEIITDAIVIVSPIDTLLERAAGRKILEVSLDTTTEYPSESWHSILSSVDHFAMYNSVLDILESYRVPYLLLFNGNNSKTGMMEMDRCYLHHALRGNYHETPSRGEIEEAVKNPGAEYQTVRLPGGHSSLGKGYNHTEGSRRQSFDAFRDRTLAGTSVLDIGCAMGDVLFWYERFGATTMTGLDMKESRLQAAEAFGRLFQSNSQFHLGDFLQMDQLYPHDDVLALNVVHHVPNIHGFLEKATSLTKKRLIVEYPTLNDNKFQRLGGVPEGLDDYPLIGVSSMSVDQTFVFTKAALIRMVGEFGDFTNRQVASPIKDRKILIFERSSKP